MGLLQLIVQDDGDVIVTAIKNGDGEFERTSVEFCTPGGGGGQSPHTHKALRELALAMQRDEDERKQYRS